MSECHPGGEYSAVSVTQPEWENVLSTRHGGGDDSQHRNRGLQVQRQQRNVKSLALEDDMNQAQLYTFLIR